MSDKEYGYLTTSEITRAMEYLQKVGLTGVQIYGFWAYVATGIFIEGKQSTERPERNK